MHCAPVLIATIQSLDLSFLAQYLAHVYVEGFVVGNWRVSPSAAFLVTTHCPVLFHMQVIYGRVAGNISMLVGLSDCFDYHIEQSTYSFDYVMHGLGFS
jgi:hypothetical protein